MFHDKNIFMQIMICLRKMITVSQLRHDLFNTANITLSNQTHNSARTLWWWGVFDRTFSPRKIQFLSINRVVQYEGSTLIQRIFDSSIPNS